MIVGFHIIGSLSALDAPQEALDFGITLYAGEAENRIQPLRPNAYAGSLAPDYNYLEDLPTLNGVGLRTAVRSPRAIPRMRSRGRESATYGAARAGAPIPTEASGLRQ